jgi:PAS domain S-box-containing protein
MPTGQRLPVLRYGSALVVTALATWFRLMLDPVVGERLPLVTFVLGVVLVAWYGGAGPAVVAVVLSSLSADYFILQPRGTLLIHARDEQVALAVFFVLGLAIALLSASLETSRSRAESAEQAARVRGQELAVTLQSIGDAVIATDNEGRVSFMNPVAESLTSWSRSDANGQPLAEVFRIVNEQTRSPAEDPVTRVLREGVVVGLGNHTILIARDGSEKPIDDSAAPIRDETGRISGVVLIFRDVTQRRQLERLQRDLQRQLEEQVRDRTSELRASEERFRLLVEGSTDYAIFMLGPTGHIASWNPGAQRIKGYRADEIIGQHFSRFYPPEDIESRKPERELQIATAKGKYEEEGWRLRKDGSRFWASVLITALRDEAGGLRGFSKITRDRTEQRRAEEALQKAHDELEERVRQRTAELAEEHERLRVTLASIGDAVIATDPQGRVTFVNPVAESLTGWAQTDATGLPLETIFRISNEFTRRPAQDPVARVLATGLVVGLANHTILTAKDGTERPIDDSAAPIRDEAGHIRGVVLVFRDVTERRRADEARAHLAAIVESSDDAIVSKTLDAIITSWNTGAERLYGYTPAEVVGKPIALLIPTDHPDELPSTMERLRRGERIEDYETVRVRKDGRRVDVSVTISPVMNAGGEIIGASTIARDITDRKRAEARLRFVADASAALASLVDYGSTLQKVASLAVPSFADWCGVDMPDGDGTLRRVAVAHVDPAKIELARELDRRYPPDPKSPHGPYHVLRTGRSELIAEIPDELLDRSARDDEHRLILRRLGLKSFMGVPLQTRGRTFGVLTFVSAESGRRYDVSDLAVAEDLAHRAAVAIENSRLYCQLRETDRLKDEFLAMLAHELRNPLAPVRNALHVMKQPAAGAAIVAQVRDMAERQVLHMGRLLDDLLDVSRVSRGRIELRKEVVDAVPVVKRTVEAIRPLIEDRRHELTVSLPHEPLWLDADPHRLEQVLTNLLTNAAKYTDPGGQIWLTASRDDSHVVIRVRDTGVGITPEMLSRIFELFVQAERRLDRSQGGLGIGLTLVHRLVELHGGTVEASSPGLGGGSEFVVRLPALLATSNSETADHNGHAPPDRVPRRRVLVVDDNKDAADSLGLSLQLADQEVRVAHNGPDALQVISEFRPEIVFLDIGMPGMDGYEVARQIRALPQFKDLLLVAVTGWGQKEDRIRSREAGFDHHLIKPVEPATLHPLLAQPRPQA